MESSRKDPSTDPRTADALRASQSPLVPLWALALAVSLPLVAGVFGHDPWTPDEPRVAATSREMVISGNWIVPTLGGDRFVEQPPLYHLMAGASWKILSGIVGDAGAMRLVSALCGLGTILLAARIAFLLAGARVAALTAIILATSPGMLLASHSIRVDASLLLFVTASIAAAIEAYRRNRPWFLALAGVCAAAAFLSKGPIALAFIAPAVAPFAWRRFVLGREPVPPAMQSRRGEVGAPCVPEPCGDPGFNPRTEPDRWLLPHTVALLSALSLAGAWMLAMRLSDEAAWNAWFWDNQLGRFTGKAVALGHNRAGQPHYYLQHLLIGMAPWSLGLALWARNAWRNREDKPWRDASFLSLAAWGIGGLLLLTVSVTKRDIYLAPAFPAFGIMIAMALESTPPAWFRWWTATWAGILLAAAASVSITPLLFRVPQVRALRIPPSTTAWFAAWHVEHFAALALVLVAVVLIARGRNLSLHPAAIPSGVMVLSLAGLLTVLTAGINESKSLREPAENFAGAVPRFRQVRACGWALTETDRGALSFHTGWMVPSLPDAGELVTVLEGRHPRFDCAISSLPPERIPELQRTACRVRASGELGDNRHPRPLHWIVAGPK